MPRSQARPEIDAGLRTLHLAHEGQKARHLLVYRIGGDRIIDVLRILHDRMDLARHVSADPE